MAFYEYALQERIRALLRLEDLFRCLDRDLADPGELRGILRSYLEILDFCQRPELRMDLLLELDQIHQNLQHWSRSSQTDSQALQQWDERILAQQQKLRKQTQSFGESLRHQEILQLARGRQAVAGGLTRTDLPLLRFFEQQAPKIRSDQFVRWRRELDTLEESTHLILTFLRESLDARVEHAEGGRFSMPLDPRHSVSLLRLELADDLDAYPKISGGIHRLHIQFLCWIDPGPSRAVESSFPFRLALSAC